MGVRFGRPLDEGESDAASNADNIAESRGFRGAVITLEGGGSVTRIGDGMVGALAP